MKTGIFKGALLLSGSAPLLSQKIRQNEMHRPVTSGAVYFQNSMPFLARTPLSKGCFSLRISVT